MISISCLFSDGGIFRGINLVVPHLAVPFCSKWLNSFLRMYQISLYKWLPFPYKTCNFGITAPLLPSPFPDLLLSAEGSFPSKQNCSKDFQIPHRKHLYVESGCLAGYVLLETHSTFPQEEFFIYGNMFWHINSFELAYQILNNQSNFVKPICLRVLGIIEGFIIEV